MEKRYLGSVAAYDQATRQAPWWKMGWFSKNRLPDGRWLFLITGRSLRHPRIRAWYVTIEPAR